METVKYFKFGFLAALVITLFMMSLTAQQAPVQDTPNDTQIQTPSQPLGPPYPQPTAAPGIDAEPTRANSTISWGTLVFGLIMGAAAGYFLGNRPPTPAEVHRERTDRAA
jgi:hypothetical protein